MGNKVIAMSGAGMAIGEITYLTGEPATATVKVVEQTRPERVERKKKGEEITVSVPAGDSTYTIVSIR